jgi:hypothetical protein
VTPVYSKKFRDRSQASKEENRIKHLSRVEKLELIKTHGILNLGSKGLKKPKKSKYNKKIMAKGNNKQRKEKKKPKKDKQKK